MPGCLLVWFVAWVYKNIAKKLVDSAGDLNKKYKILEENFGALDNKLKSPGNTSKCLQREN